MSRRKASSIRNSNNEEEDKRGDPLSSIDVELVEGDVSGRHKNLIDEWVHSLQNSEVECFGYLLIQVRHQFPPDAGALRS